MADIKDFEMPSFLNNQGTEAVHAEMLEVLPDDLDKSEGGIAWDFTRPTAIQVAYLLQYVLPETIKQIFPQYASGSSLDYHAENRGLSRNDAAKANCKVSIKGTAGTTVPKGFKFSTESDDSNPAVVFETEKDCLIPESGTVEVDCVASVAGTSSNITIGTIILQVQPMKGIESVTNTTPATGGTDKESDDSLRERIMEFDSQIGNSFIGNASDYRRWAMTVDGVGNAKVIPATDTTGTVKIILTDKQGQPATEELLNEVTNYIMGSDKYSRLAPVNADLDVRAPNGEAIWVKAKLKLAVGCEFDIIKAEIITKVKAYLLEAQNNNVVLYSRIGALIIGIEGVEDYDDLLLNNGTENVVIGEDSIPVTDDTYFDLTVMTEDAT